MTDQHLFQCRTCSGNVAQTAPSCPHCGEKEPSKSWPQMECERAVENKARLNAALLDGLRRLKPNGFFDRWLQRLGFLAVAAVPAAALYWLALNRSEGIWFAAGLLAAAYWFTAETLLSVSG